MEKTEQIAAIGRIREFVSDVRQGRKSMFSPTDILMDLKRLEDARAEPEGCTCGDCPACKPGPESGCPCFEDGWLVGHEAPREPIGGRA